jgi:hypothetical protein
VDSREWYANALRGFENPPSVHAERADMVYGLAYHLNDDVVPSGFLAYTNPFMDLAALKRRFE